MEGAARGTVCVTGVTGFLAGHVVRILLRRGYTVHGTMRNAKDTKRVEHLTKLEGAENRLVLFSADLTIPGSFDDAVRGCDSVIHIANVVQLQAKDPMKEIIRPSVDGCLALLSSIEKEPRVVNLVLTSSYASVEVGVPPKGSRGPLTEADHNTAASVNWKPYSFSKVESERVVVEWVQKINAAGQRKIHYCSIHPPMILGPQLNSDSLLHPSEAVHIILTGQYPMCPPLWFPMVDVRDVARAHVEVMDNPAASGRYLVCNGHHWLMDLANFAREAFPEFPVPSRVLPMWLFKIVGYFDKRMDKGLLQENTVEGLHVDATKICKDINFHYEYETKQSMVDACQALIDYGIVKRPNEKH